MIDLSVLLEIAMLMVLWGILTAIKRGFNEVIKGLESLDGRLARRTE